MRREHTEEHVELVAPYLLGALNDLERQAFERHLMACEECQQDVARLRSAVAGLAHGVEQRNPPSSLKPGLMAVVEREAQARRAEERDAQAGGGWRRPALAAAAATLLALAGVGGYTLGQGGESAPVAEDDTRSIEVQVNRGKLPRAGGRLLVADGKAVLQLSGLPDPGSRRNYAVWVRRDGELTPVSLIRPLPTGTATAGIDGGLEAIDGIFVTRESQDGARAPSERPLIRVPLPRGA